MSDGLTARQAQILKALIDEYIENALPVGSEVLEKKYNLGISSATIRNEMVALIKLGYLRQPHTSAGRIPSPKAMRFYIDQLMEERQMSLADEVKAKEEVWDFRGDLENLLEEAVQALAERTKSLSVAVLEDSRPRHAGLANVFANPEFTDLEMCANIFSFLEEASRLNELFFSRAESSSPVEVIFGEELNQPELAPLSICATHFRINGRNGAFGVIGPARLSYPTVIPVLRYFGNLVQEVAGK